MKQITFILLSMVLSFAVLAETVDNTLDGSFDNGGLTDEQNKAAQEFMHEGYKAQQLNKACENSKASGKCNTDADAGASLLGPGLGAALEQNIGRLYSVIMGGLTMSGNNNVKVVSQETLEKKPEMTKKEQGKEAEKKSDYCSYAAMGYEVIAAFIQNNQQQKIQKDVESIKDLQLQSLVALKKTHEARKKTATYQSVIYGATSACYITRATGALDKGKVVLDTAYWVKMGAATALTGLYITKAIKHKKAAEAVQAVIDSLPKAGDCNPYTDTKCFCSNSTSKQLYAEAFEEVCVQKKNTNTAETDDLGCGVLVNGQITYDKACKCKQNKNCFKANVKVTNPKFKFGTNMMNTANQGFDMLGNGDFDSGKFDSYALNAGVHAAKLKDKLAATSEPKLSLTAEESKLADSLKDIMPAGAAGMIAKTAPIAPPGLAGSNGNMAALDKLSPQIKERLSDETAKYKSGGNGFANNSNQPEETLNIPTMGGEAATESGTEVISFADKAVENADVTNTPDTPIFDIISNRYKRSGWNKLDSADLKQ